jgi:hypothetical protein
MKAKLLKRIRKTADLKFSPQKNMWVVLVNKELRVWKTLEEALTDILYFNADRYDTWLDWNWSGIYDNYREKIAKRRFKKS